MSWLGWLGTYRGGLPTRRWSPIPVVIRPNTEQLRRCAQCCYYYAKLTTSCDTTAVLCVYADWTMVDDLVKGDSRDKEKPPSKLHSHARSIHVAHTHITTATTNDKNKTQTRHLLRSTIKLLTAHSNYIWSKARPEQWSHKYWIFSGLYKCNHAPLSKTIFK